MRSATTGWASTTTHLILHTTNGGRNWQDVTPPYPIGNIVEFAPAFTFLNGATAWVAIFEKQQPNGTIPNVVFRTSDGGNTWHEAILSGSRLGITQMQFVNALDGWALTGFGGGAAGSQAIDLFRTTDGGRTWSVVTRTGSQPGQIPFSGHKSGMGWASATIGWVTGCICAAANIILLYRTRDAGVSWQPQSLPLPASQAVITTQPPVFFSATQGVLPVTFSSGTGFRFVIYATHNGGVTWTMGSSTQLSLTNTWDVLTMQRGWGVGANGATLNRTSDGGKHWTLITPRANFRDISQLDFVSAREGWAISTPPYPAAPVLLRTGDGGKTWERASYSYRGWGVVPSPNRSSVDGLSAVAKVSSKDVWAVGGDQFAGSRTLIEHWNGMQWSIVKSPNPGTIYDRLNGITAISSTNIWAVGYAVSSGRVAQTLIEHWNGVQWSVVKSPSPGTVENSLSGVAAISSRDVWAVGMTTSASEQPLVEHWNGIQWSVVTSPRLSSLNNLLFSVTAVSARDVWAVGSRNTFGQALIEHWNGGRWSVVTSPNPGAVENALFGVTAISAHDVWAVGYTTSNRSRQTLVEHWNGSHWQVVTSPGFGSMVSSFWAVGAISARNVWAVGDVASGGVGFHTLTAQWNGSRWVVVKSPDPGTVNALDGVAIISACDVWAVGATGNTTLTEHYHC